MIDGRTLPRIAGISSFGAGGSNAHLIVEEYQAAEPAAAATVAGDANVVIVLSARTAEQLRQKARDLLDFVRPRLNTIDLVGDGLHAAGGPRGDGRTPGLRGELGRATGGKARKPMWPARQSIEDAYQGQVKRNKEALSLFSTDADLQQTIDKWIANRKLSKLVELWVKGLELDWSKLYGEVKPRRVSLPTYPFARERYWIDTAPAAAPCCNGWARGRKRGARGPSSIAAQQHFGPEPAALPLDVHRRRVFPERPSSRWYRGFFR